MQLLAQGNSCSVFGMDEECVEVCAKVLADTFDKYDLDKRERGEDMIIDTSMGRYLIKLVEMNA